MRKEKGRFNSTKGTKIEGHLPMKTLLPYKSLQPALERMTELCNREREIIFRKPRKGKNRSTKLWDSEVFGAEGLCTSSATRMREEENGR